MRFRTLPGAIDGNSYSTGDAIAALVGFDTDDLSRLAREVSLLLELPDAVREAITEAAAIPDSYMSEVEPIDAWLKRLAGNLSEKFVGPARALSEDSVKALKLVADALELNAPEPTPEPDVLVSLRTDADQLLQEVLEADLDARLARYLVGHLRHIVEALDDYRLAGIVPTNDAIARALGDAYLCGIRPVDYEGTPRKLVDRFWNLVGRAADLATVGTALAQAHEIIGALTTGKH